MVVVQESSSEVIQGPTFTMSHTRTATPDSMKMPFPGFLGDPPECMFVKPRNVVDLFVVVISADGT